MIKAENQKKRKPFTAQDTIPYKEIYKDGICRTDDNYYSKMVQFYDINYQLAQNDDKAAIFENYCEFLNSFDSSVEVQITFLNQQVNFDEYAKNIDIPEQDDCFNDIRKEYSDMLKMQLSKGNNGLVSVSTDQAENGIMLLATDTPWDDATNIEANKYYYYSDGQLHPFDTVMGQGGNDSYKYVRYKAGGKTYTVNAYCMQHSMQSPPSGTTYKNMVELDEGGDDKYLRKALFYGYGGPGWGHTFNGYNVKSIMEKYGCSSETRAMQHYLVDYLYDGESGFGGALSTTAKNMLKEIKAALAKMPDPTAMKLLPGLSVNATGKETESFTWKANEAFTITIHLENGVSLVNETTGKTASGNVTVKGGEKFHLVATTANMGSLKGKYAITSNFPLDFHAMLLKLESSQDIGFGYYTDSSDLQITVDWPEEAVIEITKKDGDSMSGWKSIYNITNAQEYILIVLGGYLGCLFMQSLTMLVSAKTNSSVIAVIVPFILIFLPSFLSGTSLPLLNKILGLLPDQMLQMNQVVKFFNLYEIGGKVFCAVPILIISYSILLLLIVPVIYFIYRRKEVYN